ncbi:MAG: DUF3536 domain-containing protein [Elusimicrobiota bacterium]|nr:DUF3536 domain-containing protein [Elusimicrobiota bacterium]
MTHRHVCVHAHLYQPPRENPWLGMVEREDSAFPYHDWNARISEESYGPLTLGVKAGSDGRVIAQVDTLRRLSFNAGPTLLDWLERERPSLYARILEADLASRADGGPGAAIAQPYFHCILPLCSRRDKETLVRWGLADFEARFGRKAQGMWLPETAVDDETLDVLAAEGVEFTILCPTQAEAARPAGGDWAPASVETLDPKAPYLWRSPYSSSRSLAVVFYHHRLSRGVVTGETVASAEAFSAAVLARLIPGKSAQLASVASDGEFYGHHHPGAERVLALTLDLLESEGVTPTTPARFLALFPPPRECRVKQRTAWSCEHGLGRWERDCGCRSAHLPDWKQGWRAPLREALDRLAHRLDVFYEDEALAFFDDPWAARDASWRLWRTADPVEQDHLLDGLAKRTLLEAERSRALRLLLLQRERLAMFTSCGWFFDDISGVETVLVLQSAARACDLARALGEDPEPALVGRLAACLSNLKDAGDGAKVWRALVVSRRVTLERAAAHAAVLAHLGWTGAPLPALAFELGPAWEGDKAAAGGRRPTVSTRLVTVTRPGTREQGRWWAIVHRADRLDFAVWLQPASAGTLDSAALGGDFLRLSDDDFRSSLDGRFGAAQGLDAVLVDERGELFRALSTEGALSPDRALFLKRWTDAIMALRRGATGDDLVLDLLEQAAGRAFLVEQLPWVGELEERLHAKLEAVIADSSPAVLSSATRWLDALWAAGLLRGAWRLRDAQDRWSRALSAADAAPSAAKDACRALGDRLGLAR